MYKQRDLNRMVNASWYKHEAHAAVYRDICTTCNKSRLVISVSDPVVAVSTATLSVWSPLTFRSRCDPC